MGCAGIPRLSRTAEVTEDMTNGRGEGTDD
jgi:hypothetical protein